MIKLKINIINALATSHGQIKFTTLQEVQESENRILGNESFTMSSFPLVHLLPQTALTD